MLLFFLDQQAVILCHDCIEQMLLLNQTFPDRSTDQASCHQAEGCRCRTDCRCPLYIKILKHRTECACCSMSANHRDGAGTKSDQRVKPDQM